ncbi:MAG: CBS domain-containing protein [Longimicrobiales bacterium]|nr:CBS domain-containing protein [Longimicrobiales bacterium]
MATVRDIMQRDVVTISIEESARSLARLLADEEISGVPVLDPNGRVVGVASTTDLVRLAAGDTEVSFSAMSLARDFDRAVAEMSDDPEAEAGTALGFFLPEDAPGFGPTLFEDLPESTFDRATVADVMTPVSFSVAPDMEIPELCQYLVRGRIHRALVVDDGELLGIVTSQDVLRAVADSRVAV